VHGGDREGARAAGFAESAVRQHAEERTSLGRIGQPQDIPPAAVFLASADAAWITCQTLVIAGGVR
jgi:3-oxoacyl-[acyl-carrier protein] reductase